MLFPELLEGFPSMPYANSLIETRLTRLVRLHLEGYFSMLSSVAEKMAPCDKSFWTAI